MIGRISIMVTVVGLLIAGLWASTWAQTADKIPLTIATVCMNAKTDREANLGTFISFMREASGQGAHLIVFPEIALQQNPGWGASSYQPTPQELDYVGDSAETIPGNSTERLVAAAKDLSIYVAFGMTEKSLDGFLYNTSVFLGPTGVIATYRKVDLWDSSTGGNEHLSWQRGTDREVFNSPLGSIGLIICIEMGYNLGPMLAKEGADLLVTVSAWPAFAGDIYENVTRSNAIDAKLWHVISNQVGSVGHAEDYGHSRIVDPTGNIVADTGAREGMVIAQTDILIDSGVLTDYTTVMSTPWGRVKATFQE